MSLTERERSILQLANQGISDYKIARRINADPPNVTRSRKNALRKLSLANSDLMWASGLGFSVSQIDKNMISEPISIYQFFL